MNQRPLGCLFEVVETLVLTVIIFLVIQNFVAQPYRVEQESMEQTLERDQYVLVDKLTPRFNPYARGDIVVFTPPNDIDGSRTPFIKRVIGLPGDRLELRGGEVLVNGAPLQEPYVQGQPTDPGAEEQPAIEVPADHLFVMGDNRQNSTDSRQFGSVRIGDVIGRAWLRYWPLNALTILGKPDYAGIPAGASPRPATPSPSPTEDEGIAGDMPAPEDGCESALSLLANVPEGEPDRAEAERTALDSCPSIDEWGRAGVAVGLAETEEAAKEILARICVSPRWAGEPALCTSAPLPTLPV